MLFAAQVVLTDRELEIIRRIQAGAYAHPEHDAMPEYVPYYTSEQHVMPLSEVEVPKHRFVPSKWENMKITQIIKGLKDGTIVPREEAERRKREALASASAPTLLWDPADTASLDDRKGPMHIAAPKMPLPGHAESYRPPDEYLFSAEEEAAWKAAHPSDRELDFLPKKHDSLRSVGAHANLVRDRFERCLDLYLCPRSFKRRLNIDPESLVPKLPSPKDLKPFPTHACHRFRGHAAAVRSLAPSHDGQWLASGDDSGEVRLWEVATGRCSKVWRLGPDPVAHVCWNPNKLHHVLAVACGSAVFVVATGTGGAEAAELTDALLHAAESSPAGPPLVSSAGGGAAAAPTLGKGSAALQSVQWAPGPRPARGKAAEAAAAAEGQQPPPAVLDRFGHASGVRVVLRFAGAVTALAWHRKGDYFATVVPANDSGNVMVHQLSKRVTQVVIKKQMKTVSAVAFHPSQPIFFVATTQHVRVYHLTEQRMMKKLLTGCKHVSSLDVHPSGDHLVVGSYDRRVVWFDLDRGAMPYKTLKYHTKALRGVGFHRAWPLLATCSDDGTVHVFHAMVYSDLMKDPFLVPVKVLSGEHTSDKSTGGLGVLAIAFHPILPWLFSAGADHDIVLYQDL